MQCINSHALNGSAFLQIRSDPLWQKPDVIFSGPQTPGEGEHKIMEYIRENKKSDGQNWKPNQRHCIYGLDADLILLALSTHEPHFVILREIVRFGGSRGNSSRQSTDSINMVVSPEEGFMILHIGLLREYIELEMGLTEKDKELPKKGFDLEQCINDIVVMCTLIGNDFVPHLPALDIADGSLGTLLKVYRENVLAKGIHLSRPSKLNLVALLPILKTMATMEKKKYTDDSEDDCDLDAIKWRCGFQNLFAYWHSYPQSSCS